MALYRLNHDTIEPLSIVTFTDLGIKERADLQRLLRRNISAIAPDCLLLTEEFGQWEDSKRRIDLLALDRTGNLVVVELKRDEEGGHMELQALRYAAMASPITFQDAVEAYARTLRKDGKDLDAKASILDFLGWPSPDEDSFGQDVRIVLAAADFSKELTSTVLWLNERDLDIRCVRIRPYLLDDHIVMDVQQVIPLPEAADYQVQVRHKAREERTREESYRDFTRYDLRIGGQTFSRLYKRELVLRVVQFAVSKGATPGDVAATIRYRGRLWREAQGMLSSEQFVAAVSSELSGEGKQFDVRRFFCADNELFHLDGRTYAFTNQWGGLIATDAVEALLARYGGQDVSYQPSAEVAV